LFKFHRRKYAHLFSQLAGKLSVEQPYLTVLKLFLMSSCSTTTVFSFFVSELMDLLLTGEDQSQANQPNNLAEGHPM